MTNPDDTILNTVPLAESTADFPRVDTVMVSAMGPSSTPLQIGKYVLERRLGKGGMGEVWLSRHPVFDIPVAIKTLPTALMERDPVFVERFLVEARTAAKINHPNVVRVYDAGNDGSIYYIVMEFVSGGTVKAMLREKGVLSPAESLDIIIKVAEALEAAAPLNIVHRDLKPENIMVDGSGQIKVCDLGLAKVLGDFDSQLTATGVAFGTPAYMSPEQARNPKAVDCRTDIYALGVSFWQLVSGRLPFDGNTAVDIIMKHVTNPLPHPSTDIAGLPDNVGSVIAKMMAKDPDDRYQTATELLQDLRAIRDTDAATAKLHCKAFSSGGDNRSTLSGGHFRKIAIVAGLAAAVAVLALLVIRPGHKANPETPRRADSEIVPRPALAPPVAVNLAPPANLAQPDNQMYLVIDLNGGPTAATYPVAYSADRPEIASTGAAADRKLILRRIAAGTFMMGSPPDEAGRETAAGRRETQHRVTLTHDFYMGIYELTQAQWEAVSGSHESKYRGDRLPVHFLAWDAVRGGVWPGGDPAPDSFIGRLRRKTGLAFDLPTEAEWEYACRAGTTLPYNSTESPAGTKNEDDLQKLAWFRTNSGYQLHEVGLLQPNAWGLYDMHGNAVEWCLDWFAYDLGGDPVVDPIGPAGSENRSARGGGYHYPAADVRSASRHRGVPETAMLLHGGRLALVLQPKK